MLDEELHTSYLKQLHLPKDMDNLFESDAKEFQKVMMMYNKNQTAGQHRNQIEKERLSDYG